VYLFRGGVVLCWLLERVRCCKRHSRKLGVKLEKTIPANFFELNSQELLHKMYIRTWNPSIYRNSIIGVRCFSQKQFLVRKKSSTCLFFALSSSYLCVQVKYVIPTREQDDVYNNGRLCDFKVKPRSFIIGPRR